MGHGDTIYALASGRVKAGVAVIRVSGPAAHDVLQALCGTVPPPREAALRSVRTPDGELLDEALILRFDEGRSFTGEAAAELQVHGGMAVVDGVLAAIGALGVARMAQPGEFTRRAMLNGRLDLTRVQGLGDLIDAESEEQRRAALRVYGGELARVLTSWHHDLMDATALIEATIDFVDEDVPVDVVPDVEKLLDRVLKGIDKELRGYHAARRLRSGYKVAIVGAPNVGKSSLLNAIAREDVAIVSEIAGTTRDVVSARVILDGMVVTFLDTAGLRETEDPIEQLGVARAEGELRNADLVVRVVVGDEAGRPPNDQSREIIVRNKIDVTGGNGISVREGTNMDAFLADIGDRLREKVEQAGMVSSPEDQDALRRAKAVLEDIRRTLDSEAPEVVAEGLRTASSIMEGMIGGRSTEDILGRIFGRFCIGK
jgi:tRNA modification GTPase